MEKSSQSTLEKIILGLVFLLANLRALVFIFLFPDTSTLLGPAWIEILLWILATAGVVYLLSRGGRMPEYLALWRRNWPVALFLLLSLVSILWSVAPVSTLFRWLELLFATLIASYYGMRLGPGRMMAALFWFGAVMMILSIGLAYGAPPTGTMYWRPFNGVWRGVYWHRNHLASITALLNAVYLFRLILSLENRNSQGLLDGIFYVLSWVILFSAKSAAGYILVIVLHVFVFTIWIWLRISHRLRREHYYAILGAVLLAGILVLDNLNTFFGLFDRDATMTGRVGLWSHLLDLASRRLWLGHGFGAVWTIDSFREEIRQLVGWYSQPLIGDNGLVDILLHLGIIGLALFLGVLILVTVRSLRYALAQKSLLGFFPLLVMVHAVFGNVSFSLFVETEVLIWFLMVAVLFMTTSLPKYRPNQLGDPPIHKACRSTS